MLGSPCGRAFEDAPGMRHESAGPGWPAQSTEPVQRVQPRGLVPPRGPVRPECAKLAAVRLRTARAGRAALAALALAFAPAALLAAPPAAATESAAAAPARASGYASPWVRGERARLRLLAAPPCGTAAAPLLAGVEFDLAPGWKTYWRTPGAAGFGAEILWEGSQNFTRIEYFWPRPERFHLFGEETLGYEGRFILPVQVVPRNCDEPLVLEAQVLYLVCETLCIPHEAVLALTVPPMTAPGGLVAAPDATEERSGDGGDKNAPEGRGRCGRCGRRSPRPLGRRLRPSPDRRRAPAAPLGQRTAPSQPPRTGRGGGRRRARPRWLPRTRRRDAAALR